MLIEVIQLEFSKNNLLDILNTICSSQSLKLSNIPDIDLYMDQVTSFLDSKLGSFKRNKEDIIFTKTMINNYTKAKILMPPDKKKYSKDHMMLLVLIYHLKQILTINDISNVFSEILKDNKNENPDLKDIYTYFTDMQKRENISFKKDFEEKIDKVSNVNELDKNFLISLILELTYEACLNKRLIEKLIDKFFSTQDEGKPSK